eukprot:3722541-Prymnesium_polylepis.1
MSRWAVDEQSCSRVSRTREHCETYGKNVNVSVSLHTTSGGHAAARTGTDKSDKLQKVVQQDKGGAAGGSGGARSASETRAMLARFRERGDGQRAGSSGVGGEQWAKGDNPSEQTLESPNSAS